jgi:hypothetical protein
MSDFDSDGGLSPSASLPMEAALPPPSSIPSLPLLASPPGLGLDSEAALEAQSCAKQIVWIPVELNKEEAFGEAGEPWLVLDPFCASKAHKRRLPTGEPVKKQLPSWMV